VYGSVYKEVFKAFFKKKIIRLSKGYKKLNSKYFFLNWNQHSQDRSGLNITKAYLLSKNLWYFQKKNNLQLPVLLKKNTIENIKNITYLKINSKLNDYIKKIFKNYSEF
jgi:hypothetical protein